jgi:hypothetical protein
MEDVAVIFGQPQLLVVELPYGDCEEEFAQQGYNYSLAPGSPPQEHNYYIRGVQRSPLTIIFPFSLTMNQCMLTRGRAW